MSYAIKRKGRVICKVKASRMTAKLAAYLVDTLGYTISGTYQGFRETSRQH